MQVLGMIHWTKAGSGSMKLWETHMQSEGRCLSHGGVVRVEWSERLMQIAVLESPDRPDQDIATRHQILEPGHSRCSRVAKMIGFPSRVPELHHYFTTLFLLPRS